MLNKEKIEKIKIIKKDCLENCKNFIEAAKKLDEFPNIKFHLALLAIEEIGKIHLYWRNFLDKDDLKHNQTPKKIDDHEVKIYLALLFKLKPIYSITLEHINDCRVIAKNMHLK